MITGEALFVAVLLSSPQFCYKLVLLNTHFIMKPGVKEIIQSSLVMAFTIAAALIWKDVITEVIETFVPAGDELLFKVFGAIFATILVILGIYLTVKTESGAEEVIERAEHYAEKFRNRNHALPPQSQPPPPSPEKNSEIKPPNN